MLPGMSRPESPEASAALAAALRLPVFATVTTGLAVGAHVVGGGSLPGPGTIVLLTCLVALGFSRFTQHESSFARLLLAVGAVQIGLHLALLDPHDHAHPGHTGNPLGMALAHAAAVAVVAWWLRRGEAATWRALRRVLPVRREPVPWLPTLPARSAPLVAVPVACHGRVAVRDLPRRGPPQA